MGNNGSFLDQPGTGGGILPPYGPSTPTPASNAGANSGILPPVTEIPQPEGFAGSMGTILPPVNPPYPPILNPKVQPTQRQLQSGTTINPGLAARLTTMATTTQVQSEGSAAETPIDDCMRSILVIGSAAENSPPTSGTANVFVNGSPCGSQQGQFLTFGIPNPFGGPLNYISLLFAEVPLTCCLNVGDSVQTSVTIDGVTSALSSSTIVESSSKYSVTTQHYNIQRTGWNSNETTLTPANVGSLTKLFDLQVDGKTYAQPLYLHHLYFPQTGASHNVVFIATENDSVYAFDADSGTQIWHSSLLQTNQVPAGIEEENGDLDVVPVIGITGTPVIDCGCGGSSRCSSCCECSCGNNNGVKPPPIMYVVSKGRRQEIDPKTQKLVYTYHLYLHALDVTTGLDLPNSPVEIRGTVKGNGGDTTGDYTENDGNGNVIFNAHGLINRSALLLLDGTVYVAICALADPAIEDPNGWIFSYCTKTLTLQNIFCSAPDKANFADGSSDPHINAGIWQSGMGLASDGEYIYCTTADGAFNANAGGQDHGDSALKLTKDLRVVSWFAPANQETLNRDDVDFGSSGVLVIPLVQATLPSNLMVTTGKSGVLFLLNRDDLGGYAGPKPYQTPNTITSDMSTTPDNPNAVFSIHLQKGTEMKEDTGDSAPGPWGGPAYFRDASGQQYLFYCGNQGVGVGSGNLTAFSLTSGVLARLGTTSGQFPLGGSTVVVSSNHQTKGSAIVWAIGRDSVAPPKYPQPKNSPHNLWLRAYDASKLVTAGATNVPSLIGDATNGLSLPTWGSTRAFIEPTIINGKVFIAWDTFDWTKYNPSDPTTFGTFFVSIYGT